MSARQVILRGGAQLGPLLLDPDISLEMAAPTSQLHVDLGMLPICDYLLLDEIPERESLLSARPRALRTCL